MWHMVIGKNNLRIVMTISPLAHENAHAYFDGETGIAYITYSGILSADVTTAVYNWLGDLLSRVGMEHVYGEIFDFTDVTEFMPDNLVAARRKSRRYNMRNNVRRLPVAMIVSNFYQEELLRGPLQNVEENKRKTIVRSMDEARAFLKQWHTENALEEQ